MIAPCTRDATALPSGGKLHPTITDAAKKHIGLSKNTRATNDHKPNLYLLLAPQIWGICNFLTHEGALEVPGGTEWEPL